MNLSIRAEHIDQALVGFGALWVGSTLILTWLRRKPRRRTSIRRSGSRGQLPA